MEKLCRLLEISRSGYYAWLVRGPSRRTQHNQLLTRELVCLHEKYPAQGLDSLYHMLKPEIPLLTRAGSPADEDRRPSLHAKKSL